MERARGLPSTILFALLLVACGSRTALYDGEVPGVSGDAESSDDAGQDDGALPVGTTHLGYVIAEGTAGGTTYAFAEFLGHENDSAACGYAVPTGGCVFARCRPNPLSRNAGTIVASAPGGDATLVYQGQSPNGTYPPSTLPNSVDVMAGDTVTFTGSGSSAVPAFDAMVTMPPLGQILQPAFVPEETIDTTSDLDVSWQSLSSGDAVFVLSTENGYGIECFFDGQSGSGVVPSSDLAALKAHTHRGQADAAFLAMSRSQVIVSDWTVEALASIGSGGDVAQFGPVTLE
jgi:hypothetical protein